MASPTSPVRRAFTCHPRCATANTRQGQIMLIFSQIFILFFVFNYGLFAKKLPLKRIVENV